MNENSRFFHDPSEPSFPVAGRGRFKSFLLGVLILFFGMVIGAAATLFVGHQMLSKALQPGHEMATHLTRGIERKLDLNDAQKIQVRKIVDARVAAFRGILGDVYPKILGQFELLHTEVGQLLTEEQKIKWEAHYEKIRENVLSHMPPSQVQKDRPE